VTPAKDQGFVGTCWAFSTTGNIEGQWFLSGKPLPSLSEEQISDCDGYDCAIMGGWPCRAYQYVVNVGGLMSEADYPYCAGTDQNQCFPCAPPGYNQSFCGPYPSYCNSTLYPCKANKNSKLAAKISGWKSFSQNETQLLSDLITNGPLSVLINSEGLPPLEYHRDGVWNPYMCGADSLDHAVLLVGYGVDKGMFEDTPYWIVKNSWGQDWADDQGFFKMARGTGLCGVNTAVTSAYYTNANTIFASHSDM